MELAPPTPQTLINISTVSPILQEKNGLGILISPTDKSPSAPFKRLTGPSVKIKYDLWKEARGKLNDKEKQDLEKLEEVKKNTLSIVEEVISGIRASQERVKSNLIKITTRKGEIVLRHFLDKIANWALKFREVGDVLIQYDPAHAALPWAGVRVLLMLVANDSEIFREMAEGVELVSEMTTRYAIIESLYLLDTSALQPNLIDAIVKLYTLALQFLISAYAYYKKRTAQRSLESVFKTAANFVECPVRHILQAHERVEAITKVIDAEITRSSDRKLLKLQDATQTTMEEMMTLRLLSLKMLQDLGPIESLATELTDQRRREEQLKRVEWLSRVRVDLHHARSKEGLVKDSGKWIFERHGYIDWKDNTNSSALWLHGIVGCGKTSLVSVVIERLLDERELNFMAPKVAYFYCNGSEVQRTKADEILRSVARQLVWSGRDEPLRQPFVQLYEKLIREAEEKGVPEPIKLNCDDSTSLIIDLLEGFPAYIVIDALDECRERPILLKALTKILRSKGKVKLFISGRDDITRELSEEFPSQVNIRATDNRSDIERFIQSEVDNAIADRRLLNGTVSKNLQDEIIRVLTLGANGMFLWVKLQIQNLIDKRMKLEKDVRKELGRLPPGIGELYENIYHQLESSGEGSRSDAIAILSWLLISRRPLSTKALIEAVSTIEDGELSLISKNDVLTICCNLVVADGETDTFRFAHLSVQEFLQKRPAYQPQALHAVAATRCIAEFSGSRASLRPEKSNFDPQSFRSYAVAQWDYHFFEAKGYNKDILDDVHGFLQDDDAFSAFHNEAMDSEERKEYHGAPFESMAALAHTPTPLFEICMLGLMDSLRDIEDEIEDWNAPNIKGDSPLHLAAAYGHEEIVKFLLERPSIQVNQRGEFLKTSLFLAAETAGVRILKLLLAIETIDVNLGNQYNTTPLSAAAMKGEEECAELLLKHGADKDLKDDHGRSPLLWAAASGREKMVQRLLKAKVNTDIQDNGGKTVLHLAIEGDSSDPEPLVAKLLKSNVFIEAQDNEGSTALHAAAGKNQGKIIERLLKKGILVGTKDLQGKTALDHACRANNKDIIMLLLKNGATCEPDLDGRTELHEAIEGGCDAEVVELFLKHNVDLNKQTNSGETALQLAVTRNDDNAEAVVKLLLDAGAKVETRNVAGESPLHSVSGGGSVAIAKMLLSKGADLAVKCNVDRTPLAFACFRGSEGLTRLFLDNGADVNVVDNGDWTMLQFAAYGESDAVVKLIMEHPDNKIDLMAKNYRGETALDVAAQTGKYAVVRTILALGPTKSLTEENRTTPLHAAAAAVLKPQQFALIEALLDAGFNVHARNEAGRTALHEALLNGSGKDDIIQLLLDRGSGIEDRDEDGDTALLTLARSGHKSKSICTILLKNGANVNAINKTGSSSMWYMAGADAAACCRLLLESGASASTADLRGRTPLQNACSKAYIDVVRVLLEFGAEVNVDGPDMASPMHIAAGSGAVSIMQMLADKNADVNLKTKVAPTGRTPLHCAARRKEMEPVLWLLEHGVNEIDPSTQDGLTPLHYAAHEVSSTFRVFLERGADIKKKSNEGQTALHIACASSSLEFVRVLVGKGAEIQAVDSEGYTPIHKAAKNLNEAILLYLLSCDQPFDVNRKCTGGFTALILAASTGKVESVKKLLTIEGCKPEQRADDGRDALSYAAGNGHTSVVLELLKVDTITIVGTDLLKRSPLHYACEEGHQEIVRHLLEKDAGNINFPDRAGEIPLVKACHNKREEVIKVLLERPDVDVNISHNYSATPLTAAVWDNSSIAKILLEREDIDVTKKTKLGRTAIWWACSTGQEELFDIILTKPGAEDSLAIADKKGITPLHRAVISGHVNMVKRTLTHEGVNVDARDFRGRSPLWHAAKIGREDIAEELLKQKVDVDAVDQDGKTPLYQAARQGFTAMVSLLIQSGARQGLDDALEVALSQNWVDVVQALVKAGMEEPQDWNMFGTLL